MSDVPLLPHRSGNQLVWATGTVRGAWTRIELEWAIAHGATVERWFWAHTHSDSEAVYEPWVRKMLAAREKAVSEKDTTWATVLKCTTNSCSGKLAERPERENIKIYHDGPPGPGWEPVLPRERHWRCTYQQVPANARPIQAAYTTGRPRMTIGERLMRASPCAIYCDTDADYSIHEDPIGVDPVKMGSMKLEGDIVRWVAYAPKLAKYRDSDGKVHVRAKGIPGATEEDFDRLGHIHTKDCERDKDGVLTCREHIVEKVRGVETFKLRVAEDDGRFFVARKHTKQLQRDRNIAGTRWIESDHSTTPLHREKDGTYRWPSTNSEPSLLLPFLRTPEDKKRK